MLTETHPISGAAGASNGPLAVAIQQPRASILELPLLLGLGAFGGAMRRGERGVQVGDARGLDGLSDDSFQAATMAFGIRNIPEKEEALCEIWRVLDKGAGGSKLAILEFSEPGPDAGILGHVIIYHTCSNITVQVHSLYFV